MSENVVSSYVISLGYDLPASELIKLSHFLGDTQHVFSNHTHDIAKTLLTWQVGIVGAFNAVAGATLGLVDHTITADQGFRLMGERMMLGTAQARELSLALKATGMTLDQAMWDPLGRSETAESIERQQRMMAALQGGDYDEISLKLQRLKFEVMDVTTDLDYLERFVILDLLKSMGMTPDEALAKMRRFHDWFIQEMPGIASEISSDLMPVLRDWKNIMASMVPLFEDLGLVFTNFVGLLNGDKSIEGTAFSFQKVGHAIGDVMHDFDRFLQFIVLSEKMLLHFGVAAELLFQRKWKAAAKEFQSGLADLSPTTGAIVGGVVLGVAGAVGGGVGGSEVPIIGNILGAVGGGVGGVVEGAGLGWSAGSAKQAAAPTNWHGTDTKWVAQAENSGFGTGTNGPLNWMHALSVARLSDSLLPLLHAQAKWESGEHQYKNGRIIESGKGPNGGAKGIMQLEDATAQGLGVNPYIPQQNLDGGAKLIGQLLNRYHGDLNLELAAYNWNPKSVDEWRARGQHWNALPLETQKYITHVEGELHITPDQHINISQITVHVQKPNASPHEIYDAVKSGVSKSLRENTLSSLVAQQGIQR